MLKMTRSFSDWHLLMIKASRQRARVAEAASRVPEFQVAKAPMRHLKH